MFKVLIADDEATIREGLHTTIEWEELACTVVGLARDGLEAEEAIRRLAPDIVLTDIKMPGKSGLEVAESARRINSDIKVILLSGYNEFEYARHALQLGAVDFLLKPAVHSEVVKTISKAVDSIRTERGRIAELARFHNEFINQLDIYRQAFLRNLLTAAPRAVPSSKEWLEERLQLYGIKHDGPLHVVLAKIDGFDSMRAQSTEENLQLLLLALNHHLSACVSRMGNGYFVPLKEDVYAVIVHAEQHAVDESLTSVCQALQQVTREQHLSITVSLGVSRLKSSFADVYQACLEAEEALRHIFYLGSESIICYSDVKHDNEKQSPSLPYTMYLDTVKSILKSLQIGDTAASRSTLTSLFELFRMNGESHEGVKTVCIDLLSQIMHAIYYVRLDWDPNRKDHLYTEVMLCETFESCYTLLDELIDELSTEIYKHTRCQYKKVIEQVVSLINAHYGEDINLSWISARIHLNSNYISRLIKSECGETFTDLLTKCRMEKAKEMLRDPQSKIYEVAESIGIPDAPYFSIKFKKYTGMSPSEYRDNFSALF